MMALVLILIAEILSGFTLRELDSWLVVMEPMRFPMTVCHALRAVVWILSFALVVLVKGRAPPQILGEDITMRVGTDHGDGWASEQCAMELTRKINMNSRNLE